MKKNINPKEKLPFTTIVKVFFISDNFIDIKNDDILKMFKDSIKEHINIKVIDILTERKDYLELDDN